MHMLCTCVMGVREITGTNGVGGFQKSGLSDSNRTAIKITILVSLDLQHPFVNAPLYMLKFSKGYLLLTILLKCAKIDLIMFYTVLII